MVLFSLNFGFFKSMLVAAAVGTAATVTAVTAAIKAGTWKQQEAVTIRAWSVDKAKLSFVVKVG